MKKLVTVLLCAFVVSLCALFYWKQSIKRPFWGLRKESLSFVLPGGLTVKKKIIIFTSSGGFGHQAATKALTEYLGNAYELQPVYVIQDVLGSLDFVHTFTFGHFYAEQFYNYCLVHHHIGWVNLMVWCGLWVFQYRHNVIKQLIQDYLYEQNPDMVISVTTVVNGATLDAAQELNIPFWVIPTDLDASMFITQIEAPAYKKFFFNSAYNLASLKAHIDPAMIPESQITYSGFPVRKSFLKSYDRNALKQEYAIPLGKPVLMLMLGGLGAHNTITYAQELSRLTKPAHCLICIGKNEALRPKLEEILSKAHTVTYTIIGFTHDIAPLMAMADLLITKSGGASINEGLYMGVPMIIDSSTRAPQWEYYNRSFIAEHGCGIVLKQVRHLKKVVERLLANPAQLQAMKHAIQRIPRVSPEQAIPKFVASLLG